MRTIGLTCKSTVSIIIPTCLTAIFSWHSDIGPGLQETFDPALEALHGRGVQGCVTLPVCFVDLVFGFAEDLAKAVRVAGWQTPAVQHGVSVRVQAGDIDVLTSQQHLRMKKENIFIVFSSWPKKKSVVYRKTT